MNVFCFADLFLKCWCVQHLGATADKRVREKNTYREEQSQQYRDGAEICLQVSSGVIFSKRQTIEAKVQKKIHLL